MARLSIMCEYVWVISDQPTPTTPKKKKTQFVLFWSLVVVFVCQC